MIDLKKIIIGTAQFGSHYGITNKTGEIKFSEVNKIIKEASNNGISFFDTAPIYGNAEKKLGKCLNKKSNIITKIIEINDEEINQKSLKKINKVFFNSLKNLKLNKVYSVLIHSRKDIYKKNNHLLIKFVKDLKKKKIVEKIGISIYEKKDFEKIIKIFKPDIIQLPISIADQRLLEENYLKRIKNMNIEIHARSIFLQGILISKYNNLPMNFSSIKDYLFKFNNKLKANRITPIQACLSFIYNIKEIDKIIIGVSSLKEFKEILKSNKKKKLNKNFFRQFKLNDSNILNPVNW